MRNYHVSTTVTIGRKKWKIYYKGKNLGKRDFGFYWRAFLATEWLQFASGSLNSIETEGRYIHTYIYIRMKICMHQHSLFSTLQSLQAVTILLSQRLKPPIQFKSSILLSGSLSGCGSFKICAWKQHTELSAY